MKKRCEGKTMKAYLAPDVIMLMLVGSKKGVELMRKSKAQGSEVELVYSPFGLYEAIAALDQTLNSGWLLEFLATASVIDDGISKPLYTMSKERRQHLRMTAKVNMQENQEFLSL
jgi:hypothetical protein